MTTKKVNLTSADIGEEQLSKLYCILPEVFSENEIDWEKLRTVLGDKIDERVEKFNFTWTGKSNAVKNVLIPSKATLNPLKDESVKFDESKNIFIEGDNLEVLKLLQKAYFEKVKMIYIDPPYNTGGDFVYHDNFVAPVKNYLQQTGQMDAEGNKLQTNKETNGRYHSDWLSMMYPRLKLAWNLLRDDGVIFVSIDDHEVTNLRMIMNEVFGEENFIALIPWKGKGGGADNKYLMVAHEYIILYAKSKSEFEVGEEIKVGDVFSKLDEKKKRKYKTQLARKWGSNSKREDRPNLFYSIKAPGGSEVFPMLTDGQEGCWRWSKQRMAQEIEQDNLEFIQEENGWIVYEKIYEPVEGDFNTKKFSTWFDDVGSTATGTKETTAILGKKVFDFPKPTSLIRRLMQIADVADGDLILDFFCGSASTAQAVIDQNNEDKAVRNFILVQLPEATDIKSEAYKAGYKTIADIAKERIRRVVKNTKDGFKVFKLAVSNYPENQFELDPEKSEEENKTAFSDYLGKTKQAKIFDDTNSLDIVYENIVKEGFSLNSTIEVAESEKCKIHIISDSGRTLMICLDKRIDEKTIAMLMTKFFGKKTFICFDNALDDTAKANLGLNIELKTI